MKFGELNMVVFGSLYICFLKMELEQGEKEDKKVKVISEFIQWYL